MKICYWILLELRKQQRLDLPVLLEARKSKSVSSPATGNRLARGVHVSRRPIKDYGGNIIAPRTPHFDNVE